MFGSSFGADHDRHVVDQRIVKRGRQSDRLRKHRGGARVGDAVQGLAPPVVGGHLQSRDGPRLIH